MRIEGIIDSCFEKILEIIVLFLRDKMDSKEFTKKINELRTETINEIIKIITKGGKDGKRE